MPKVICIKDLVEVIPHEHLIKSGITPKYTNKSSDTMTIFQTGKVYNCCKELNTICGNKIVYVNMKIRHSIGKPDYPTFLFKTFATEVTEERKKMGGYTMFDEYFVYVM